MIQESGGSWLERQNISRSVLIRKHLSSQYGTYVLPPSTNPVEIAHAKQGANRIPCSRHPVACSQITGLEELLNTGHGLVAEAAQPAAGIPHASEAYIRLIEKARAGLSHASPSNLPNLT